jgi:DNA-binding MarR family transcriptional regulator
MARHMMKYPHYVVTSQMTGALDRLLEVTVLLDADMRSTLSEQGLTPARTHLLWELGHRGPSTQRVLAEALDVSARNVTGLVDALEETGFVVRRPHPDDRRATLVTLTDRGSAAFDEMRRGHVELAHLLFASMPTRELDCLVRGLDSVLAVLREVVPGGSPTDG